MLNRGDLPAELVYYIFTEFRIDYRTLEKCALVCRSWHLPARTQRFHRIHLSYYTDCRRYHNILTYAPYIRRLIKCVHFSPLDLLKGISIDEVTSASESFAVLVSSLTEIQELILGTDIIGRWDEIPPSFRDSIITLFRMPLLTCLQLSCWRFHGLELKHLLQLPESLTRLVLDGVYILDDGVNGISAADGESSTLSRARPRELFIKYSGSKLDWLLDPNGPVDLRSVQMIDFSTIRGVPLQLLKFTASSLEFICFRFLWGPESHIDFSLNSILQTLRLDVTGCGLPTWLEASIATFPDNNNCLEVFRMDFSMPMKDEWIYDPGWTRFASTLASAKFPFLRKVEVSVSEYQKVDSIQGIKDAFHPLGLKLLLVRRH